MNITDNEFNLLRKFLFLHSGIEISDEKKYLFTTRLHDVIQDEACGSFTDLYQKLQADKDGHLSCRIVESMTTHESGFFRDGHPYTALANTILPLVAANKIRQAHFMRPRLRLLSAGCSFGQEPYSIAICIDKWLSKQSFFSREDISINGIDISEKALIRARKGVYSELEMGKALSPEDRTRYFEKSGNWWNLTEQIKKMVVFEQMNLERFAEPAGVYDVVFCRNVFIYFPFEIKKMILKRLHASLTPNGILFIGSAENLYNADENFNIVSEGHTTYYQAKTDTTQAGFIS
jgi:chemotaxis protein methyltransferase CheR